MYDKDKMLVIGASDDPVVISVSCKSLLDARGTMFYQKSYLRAFLNLFAHLNL